MNRARQKQEISNVLLIGTAGVVFLCFGGEALTERVDPSPPNRSKGGSNSSSTRSSNSIGKKRKRKAQHGPTGANQVLLLFVSSLRQRVTCFRF